MERLRKQIINCETGEETIVDYTDEEMEQHLKMRAEYEAEMAELEAKAQAAAEIKASAIAKLAALGLTEEEAAALANN